MRPFEQLPLGEVPPSPRLPHPYLQAEAREMTVVIDGGPIRTHLRTWGEGPPLLLVHGLMTAGYSWRYVMDGLGSRYRLYIVDLPGAGRSEKSRHGYRPDEVWAWLSALVDSLGIRGCPVIGNSMGGYLCMGWVLADPEAACRLVNVHSPGFPEARLHALRALLSLPGTVGLLGWLIRRDPRRWIQRNVHYWDETLKSVEELDEYAAPLVEEGGAAAFHSILRETMAPGPMRDLVRALEARREAGTPFPVPLQLVYARQDPVVPPAFGPRLHALVPEAELVWIEEGSHFAHVDAVDAFLPPVLRFLEAGPSS